MIQMHNCDHWEAFPKNIGGKSCAAEYNLTIALHLKAFVTENNMTQLCT